MGKTIEKVRKKRRKWNSVKLFLTSCRSSIKKISKIGKCRMGKLTFYGSFGIVKPFYQFIIYDGHRCVEKPVYEAVFWMEVWLG
jgi:hypothetical protein